MTIEQSYQSSQSSEPKILRSLYDTLAHSVTFAEGPGRTTTMSVETTDADPDPFAFC